MEETRTFLRLLMKERRIIKNAPLSFAIAVLSAAALLGLVIWFVLGAIIETKDATIQAQDRWLSEYRQKLNGASPDEAAAKIEALSAELQKLKEPYWRSLSLPQISALRDYLKSLTARPVSIRYAGVESHGLAGTLRAAFEAAGWTDVGLDSFGVIAMKGIRIESNDEDASTLEAAIETTTEIPVRVLRGEKVASDRFVLMIGSRPLGSE